MEIYQISNEEHFSPEDRARIARICQLSAPDVLPEVLAEAEKACAFYGFQAPLAFSWSDGLYRLYSFIDYPYYDKSDQYAGMTVEKMLEDWRRNDA